MSKIRIYSFLFAMSTLPCPAQEASSPPDAGIRKVDVGGRRLTLLSRGGGTPTVIIEAGLGEPAVESGSWKPVIEAISRTNRVVLYDRAGLGSSDAPPARTRTSRDAARDLNALLKNARIPGPYVLVGHSVGGLNARIFADLYPDDVAGLVLVDATHPDQEARWLDALGPETAGEPKELKSARDFLRHRLADPAANPEGLDVVASAAQVRTARPLGETPLVVLSHSPEWKMVPDLPDAVSRRLEQASLELQRTLLGLSKNSTHAIARKAGHGLHAEDPELVIEAIRQVSGKVARRG
ncbi:MAG: alpha/beta hydrolase [Isosphaeraceae bacterium]